MSKESMYSCGNAIVVMHVSTEIRDIASQVRQSSVEIVGENFSRTTECCNIAGVE